MTTNCICCRWLPWLAGTLVVAGMALAMIPETVPAQATKADTKTKAKKDKAESKKEAKSDVPPTTFPKRIDQMDGAKGGSDQVSFIDEHILKGWQDNKTFPSERCTDYEFIRRVSLDVIGRIPTMAEMKMFMAHPEKTRRSWLVNELLDGKDYGSGQEYAQNFANLWTVYLMTRTGSGKHYQAQMNDWLYNNFKGSESAPNWSKVAYELIAGEGDTNRNSAVNYLLHNLGEENRETKDGKWSM